MILLNILGQNYFMCYLTLYFILFFTSFDAPVLILTHMGACFDSPEALLISLSYIQNFRKYGKVTSEYQLQVSPYLCFSLETKIKPQGCCYRSFRNMC